MMTFDRGFARLLLEICRYTYAAGFNDQANAADRQDSLDLITRAGSGTAFVGLGTLCYGSNKTHALRVDIGAEDEARLFYDRVWSLIRHPERWAEHHHLAGTTAEVQAGRKGNYTALVSDFPIVS